MAPSRQSSAMQNLQKGTFGTEGDEIDRTIWDEEILAAAALNVRLFQNPIGAGGKLMDQTNNTQAGLIPNGRKLVVHALKVFWLSQPTGAAVTKTTALLVEEFFTQLARTTAQFMIANREFGQWTLQELFNVSMLVSINPAVTVNLPFVQPSFNGIFPLNKPITLSAMAPFFIEITHSVAPTAATIGDRFRFGLAGIEKRL